VTLTAAEAIATCASYRVLHPQLHELARAIQRHEGYDKGTRAFRNNNPGNLRFSPLASRTEDGFAVFDDYYIGLAALLRDLWGKCTGHTSTGLTGNSTLADLIAVFAPPNENDTARYLEAVAQALHFSTPASAAMFSLRNLL
jgi:hypothetical protein